MLSSVPPVFGRLREQVEALMEAGESLADVERAIDRTSLHEDEKAALWLVAWSLNDRSEPRPRAGSRAPLTLLHGSLEA
jgi:hypothetical protein